MTVVSFPRRLADLAVADPDRPAITCGDDRVTRAELEARADALARRLRLDGVTPGDMVTIALPNSVDWFVSVVAVWKLGAIPQPVSARLPHRELAAIVELADPPVVLGAAARTLRRPDLSPRSHCRLRSPGGRLGRRTGPGRAARRRHLAGLEGADLRRLDRPAEADRGRRPAPSSTTRPRPALPRPADGCMVMPGPLYHNGPIVWACTALLAGQPRRWSCPASTPRRRWPRSSATGPTWSIWCRP